MYQDIWNKKHKSVCSIVFMRKSHSKIMGLTGFLSGKFIITDDIIYNVKDADEVKISFYNANGINTSLEAILPIDKFQAMLPVKSEFDNLGIALIPSDFLELNNPEPLTFCRKCNDAIGKNIAVINYQSEQDNLSLNGGVISSYYLSNNNLSYMQFQGAIKFGISGAPLLDVDNGVVIGVVTNKLLSILNSYKELMSIINTNLKMLNEVEGKWQIDNIDLIQVLLANQNQIKQIAKQFLNAMSFKVGFALEVSQIIDFMERYYEYDIENIQLTD